MRAQHLKPRRESGVVISLRQQCTGFAPFPVSPSGGKRGAPPPPLRATARAKRRPKAERSSAFWAGKEETLFSWGLRRPQTPRSQWREPRTLCCKPDISLANKTGQLDKLTTGRD